jgi:hypothetical protein
MFSLQDTVSEENWQAVRQIKKGLLYQQTLFNGMGIFYLTLKL